MEPISIASPLECFAPLIWWVGLPLCGTNLILIVSSSRFALCCSSKFRFLLHCSIPLVELCLPPFLTGYHYYCYFNLWFAGFLVLVRSCLKVLVLKAKGVIQCFFFQHHDSNKVGVVVL